MNQRKCVEKVGIEPLRANTKLICVECLEALDKWQALPNKPTMPVQGLEPTRRCDVCSHPTAPIMAQIETAGALPPPLQARAIKQRPGLVLL